MMRGYSRLGRFAWAFLLLGVGAGVACSGDGGTGPTVGDGGQIGAGGTGGSVAGGGSGALGGAGGGFTFPPTAGSSGSLPDGGSASGGAGVPPGTYDCLKSGNQACAGELYASNGLPLDIFVMFDQSGSMATKDDGSTMRIDSVRGAVGQFLAASESSGMGVGIGYFGTEPLSCACTSCNANDYATPSVPVGTLPGNAGALMGSLSQIAPTGETPTGAAIRGACSYAKSRKQANPERNIVLLLVTDGEPKAPLTAQKGTCNPTLDDAVAAAAACTAEGIRTYVLGIGPALQNLNQIAAAGNTSSAYLVENGGGPEILKALNLIRSDADIPCALQIPTPAGGGRVDYQKVNVVHADAACQVTTLLNVHQASGCSPAMGGWYYDNPTQPGTIHLCPSSCERVGTPGGQLVVSVGCATRYIE